MHRRALKPSLHKQPNWSGPVGGGDGVTHIHCPLTQVWPEGQPQTEPHTSVVGQHDPFRQVLPEQQSLSPLQVPSPLGIQVTHVPLDSSQIPEQHWASLVQAPAFAMQQVPLLHVWPLGQVPQLPPHPSGPHVLPVQFGVQHEPLTQVWPEAQGQ